MNWTPWLVIGVVACAAPSGEPEFSMAHRAAIVDSVEQRLTAFRATVATMEPDSVSQFYVADSTLRWIEDGVVRYTSRGDIATALREAAPFMHDAQLLYDGTTITPLAPGVASIVTGFAQKFTMPDGTRGGFAGAITAVMVHTAEGWQFQTGHTSSAGRPRGEADSVVAS
jgi:hypothetical protein